jgi:hypothetical protein
MNTGRAPPHRTANRDDNLSASPLISRMPLQTLPMRPVPMIATFMCFTASSASPAFFSKRRQLDAQVAVRVASFSVVVYGIEPDQRSLLASTAARSTSCSASSTSRPLPRASVPPLRATAELFRAGREALRSGAVFQREVRVRRRFLEPVHLPCQHTRRNRQLDAVIVRKVDLLIEILRRAIDLVRHRANPAGTEHFPLGWTATRRSEPSSSRLAAGADPSLVGAVKRPRGSAAS